MKQVNNIIPVQSGMTEEKKLQIKELINLNWDNFETKRQLTKFLEAGFIFGPFNKNEHYLLDEYMALINEVEIEKTPVEDVSIVEETTNNVDNEGI